MKAVFGWDPKNCMCPAISTDYAVNESSFYLWKSPLNFIYRNNEQIAI
jgi:hypothetical protein